jgi:hypothetical protein
MLPLKDNWLFSVMVRLVVCARVDRDHDRRPVAACAGVGCRAGHTGTQVVVAGITPHRHDRAIWQRRGFTRRDARLAVPADAGAERAVKTAQEQQRSA